MEKEDIYVNKLHYPLKSDFAFGIDLSEVLELEELGAKWYDEEGNEKDVFTLFSEAGFNAVRLRLWNDPYAHIGDKLFPYGGGTNSLERDLILGRRARDNNMSLCLDYHLSDSYTDPETHHLPKAWQNLPKEAIADTVYRYIRDTLLAFKKENIVVSSVQVGNECISAIAGANLYSDNARAKEIFRAGIKGVKEVYPKAKTILHFTDIHHAIQKYLLPEEGCGLGELPFDVIGFSYYPFWHGTLKDYESALSYVKEHYPDKETMVMETSYGYTDKKHNYVINQFHSWDFGSIGRFVTSPQGQATALYRELDILAKCGGSGIFYWAGAWLPIKNTQYISKYGKFYLDHARDPYSEEEIEGYSPYLLASWSNQALFDYEGKALPSLYTFKHILAGDRQMEDRIIGLRYEEITLPLEHPNIPQYVDCISLLGNITVEQIDWEPYSFRQEGDYKVKGRIISVGLDVEATIHIRRQNYLHNGGFEDKSIFPFASWAYNSSATSMYQDEPSLPLHPHDGERFIGHIGKGSFSMLLSQIADLEQSDDYIFSAHILAKGVTIKLQIGLNEYEMPCESPSEYKEMTIDGIHLEKGNTLFSMSIKGEKGSYFAIDDLSLVRML